MTALWKWAHSNEFANCSRCSHNVKSKKSKASQFDVSVGAVNNILKTKRENLGDPLG